MNSNSLFLISKFEGFYNKNFNGRKLTWMHNLCNADIKLNYFKKHYSVTMGTFQMAILLGFNNSTVLSLKEIQETTQLPEKELNRQIQSLLESKLITIEDNKNPESSTNKSLSEDLNESTVISLNLNYSNKRTKFKINAAVQKETPQVNQKFRYKEIKN